MTSLPLLFPLVLSIIVWVAIFIMVKTQHIKDLLPVGILNIFYFFLIAKFSETTGLAFYPDGLFPISNVPLFSLIWAAGAAILMMNFINYELPKKLFVIFVFSILRCLGSSLSFPPLKFEPAEVLGIQFVTHFPAPRQEGHWGFRLFDLGKFQGLQYGENGAVRLVAVNPYNGSFLL